MDLTINVSLYHCQAGYHVSFLLLWLATSPYDLNAAGVWVNCDLPWREPLQECMNERAAVLSTEQPCTAKSVGEVVHVVQSYRSVHEAFEMVVF